VLLLQQAWCRWLLLLQIHASGEQQQQVLLGVRQQQRLVLSQQATMQQQQQQRQLEALCRRVGTLPETSSSSSQVALTLG
jgi:hypothetical protein